MWFAILIVVVVLMIVINKMFIVVTEREQIIKERLGKYVATLEPGFHFMIPFIDKAAYSREMRERPLRVPSQSCITSDNIQVEVDGLVYIKVVDAKKASYEIENYKSAAVNLAQTTMRSLLGKLTLDETFSNRDELNSNIVKEIDLASDSWGIKVLRYEIKDISPSPNIVETMEKQMEAERAKREEIKLSEGERKARILISEAQQTKSINISEGEKAKRINEAEGKASQITLIADATAEGVELISQAMAEPGGSEAVQAQLLEQYFSEYAKVVEKANVSVLPNELANVKGLFSVISNEFAKKGN